MGNIVFQKAMEYRKARRIMPKKVGEKDEPKAQKTGRIFSENEENLLNLIAELIVEVIIQQTRTDQSQN